MISFDSTFVFTMIGNFTLFQLRSEKRNQKGGPMKLTLNGNVEKRKDIDESNKLFVLLLIVHTFLAVFFLPFETKSTL